MIFNQMSRRSFLGAMGGAVALAAAGPARAFAQADATPVSVGESIEHPTGANEVVIRIAAVGGFVPVDISLSQFPQFSLFGDGVAVTTGPMIDIFPPPALPNVRQVRLSEAGIQQVLGAATEAGLLAGDASYDNTRVTDLPTTTFTVNAAGKTTTVSAYALGFDDDPNWTDAEREAIGKLVEFANKTFDLASWIDPANLLSADEAYPITRLQIVAREVMPTEGTPSPGDEELVQEPIDWPLAVSIADATPATGLIGPEDPTRCGILEGEDAATLLAAAAQANTLTPWVSGDTSYILTFRPLLPDETGCPPQSGVPGATPVAAG